MSILDTSYKRILGIALPIIFGAFIQSLILFVDSAFLSELSAVAFMAAGMASLPYITLYMTGNGLGDAGQIFMSRHFGKSDLVGLKQGFQSNLIHLVLCAFVLFGLTQFIAFYGLSFVMKSEALLQASQEYLSVRAFGLLFSFITLSCTSYYVAIGRSRIMLYNTILLCAFNILLDYLLIFGNYGFPKLGIAGAAWATVIAEIAVCAWTLVYTRLDKATSSEFLFRQIRLSKDISRRIIKLAAPLMFQGFMAVGAWTAYFYMIEQMGEHSEEVSQILHRLYWVALIPMIGFSATTKTYVSNLLAEGDEVKIKKTIAKILFINYIFVIICIHGFILYPEWWIGIIDKSASPEIVSDTVFALQIITGSILIHVAAGTLQSVVAGGGDTKTAFLIELISIIIYLIFAYYVIFELKWSVAYVWISEYVYFSVFLLLAVYYYFKGGWLKQKI